MGWWSAENNLEVGDTTLDLTRQFLNDFSREYQEDLGRKPTLEELQYSLQLSFKANLTNEIVSDFDELEVKQVVLKTAKRPKRQKAKVGDIFAFRFEGEKYFFGRIVSIVRVGAVVEIFKQASSSPLYNPSNTEWAIEPMTINTYQLFEAKRYSKKNTEWQIIDNNPNFTPSNKFDGVFFQVGVPPVAINIFEKRVETFSGDVSKLQYFSPHSDWDVYEKLKDLM